MENRSALTTTLIVIGALHCAQAADPRLADGGEAGLIWEDGKLGAAGVVKAIALATDPVEKGGHSIAISLDSLDGAQDSLTLGWPRQAGVQTKSLPIAVMDMGPATALRVSLYAKPDTSRPVQGTLQARLFLKTGPDWLWHTTEALDGNPGFSTVFMDTWAMLESPVTTFYSAQTVPGIVNPGQLKSIGIQFFTWGGPWTGTVYIDQLELVDTPIASDVRRASLPASPADGKEWSFERFGVDGKRIDAQPAGIILRRSR